MRSAEMKISFRGPDNARAVAHLKTITGGTFTNDEIFRGKNNGHKFFAGQRCKLVGLEEYPEFNGEIIEITSIREDGPHGKAYYFKADNPVVATQLNWTYEYRLEEAV